MAGIFAGPHTNESTFYSQNPEKLEAADIGIVVTSDIYTSGTAQ